MKRRIASVLLAAFATVAFASAAAAQSSQSSTQQSPPPPSTSQDTRPATTTFLGDTGLWYVPTAEVLPAKRWSFSGYYHNIDREAGFTDVGNFIGTFGYGINGKVELFGSLRFVTRIDRDFRPIFDFTNEAGGPVNDYPLASDGWSGTKIGDLYVGAKFNIWSQADQKGTAMAVRGYAKLPTGDNDAGASTGKVDVGANFIISKEFNAKYELSGTGGFIVRSSPDEVEISNGFTWGMGVGVPTRSPLRLTAEIHGEKYIDDSIVINGGGPFPGVGVTPNKNPVDFTLGATWISPRGFFVGGGATVNLNHSNRSDFGSQFEDEGGDNMGFQFRIGLHPGVRIYVPPPPPPPPPPPQKAANRPPTVKARCEPCIVEVGKSSTVSATAEDPDGDQLKCRWTTPSGTLANPTNLQTLWTAPMQEGSVPVTITCDDGKGGTASDTVTIQVIRPPVKEYKFEDVHFDFDRYSLRPEAARILDEAIRAMQENSTLRIEIEGHTCSIGTAEYNLALGERRSNAVRDYLTSRGISADRLRTVSYGEERPKHDNSREETRRLNRRAELVVRLQQ
jgi:outer membrane protein OmpA-like peptidoglycan-associated protein